MLREAPPSRVRSDGCIPEFPNSFRDRRVRWRPLLILVIARATMKPPDDDIDEMRWSDA